MKTPIIAAFALSSCFLGAEANAQQVAPSPAPAGKPGSDVVLLSPFELKADNGYIATSSLAGSRLDSPLKDTPAIVDVFTKDFLIDIGATSLQDAMIYANNSQVDDGDAQRVNSGNTQMASQNSFQFRSRGLRGNSTRSFFETKLATDFYNVERLDDSRGPNSVLFGIGSAGGIVNNSPKRVLFGQSFAEIQAQVGSNDSSRSTVDLNLPLVRQRLGVRLNGMYEVKNSWRDYLGTTRRAGSAAVTYRPFANTEIRLDGERGGYWGTIARNYPVNDGATRWWRNGQAVVASVGTTAPTAADTALGLNRPVTTSRMVFVENQNYLMDVRNFWGTVADTPYNSSILRDPVRVPYTANAPGPGGRTIHDFSTFTAIVEQRFTPALVGEIGYYHEAGKWLNYDSAGTTVIISGDPNGLLRNPTAFFGLGGFSPATDAAGNFVNPNAGGSYVETAWQRRTGRSNSDSYRGTLAYEKNLGRWGRHRLAALVQRQTERTSYIPERDAWLGAPFNTDPGNDNNAVWRRAYVTLGDSRSQRVPDPLATKPFSVAYPGRAAPLTNAWIWTGGSLGRRTIDSRMLAAQSRWWGDRVVTTLGYRRDALDEKSVSFSREATGVWAGSLGIPVLNDSSPARAGEYAGHTTTAGAVFHATKWLSVFANTSRNIGLPSFGPRLGPDGIPGPPPDGKGMDAGLLLSLRDDRIVARVSYFTTVARGVIASMGVDSFSPSYNNIISILEDPNGDGSTADRLYTPAQMAKYSELRPRATANADLSDNDNRGVEFRVTANVSDSLRFVVNYAYAPQEQSGVYRYTIPLWDQLAMFLADVQAANPGVNVGAARGTQGQDLATLHSSVRADIDGRKLDFESAFGNRTHKANFFANYTFRKGPLSGWAAGFGGRYLSPIGGAGRVVTPPGVAPSIAGANVGVGLNGPQVYGSDSLRFDAMLRYATRATFLGRNNRVSIQLNVRNLLDWHGIEKRRYKSDGITLDRFALTDPRDVTLSANLRY